MKLYDAHCHLNIEGMYPKSEEYLQNFVDHGGAGIVNVGCDDSYNEKGLDIAKRIHNNNLIVRTTLGLHPEAVGREITKENISSKIKELRDLIENNRQYVVAVGECGIDLHFTDTPENFSIQKELFIAQCELARELQLPLMVHSRDAFDQTMDVLKNYQDLVVYFHCRGYGPEEIQRLMGVKLHRLFIGFCGNVSYKSADNLREALKIVHLDSLLLETDAPFLAPQVVRGQTNEPAFVKYIYEFVAEYLSMDIEKLAQQCEHNFKELYNV